MALTAPRCPPPNDSRDATLNLAQMRHSKATHGFLLLLPLISGCGGTTSSESNAGTGGSGATVCTNATVTVQVVPAASTGVQWCMGQSTGCSSNWLTIRDSSGDIVLSNSCMTPCDTCMMMGCPVICAIPSELGVQGLTYTWNGTYYKAGTCGASASPCLSPQCAPAGQYTAKVCGFANPTPDAGYGCANASSSTQVSCVEKPFEFPSSASIVVTMPAQ